MECPGGEEVIYPFPKALAIYLVNLGYMTREQSARLGYDLDKIDAERVAATSRYEEQRVNGWFFLTRVGICTRARSPGSPAEMVTWAGFGEVIASVFPA